MATLVVDRFFKWVWIALLAVMGVIGLFLFVMGVALSEVEQRLRDLL